MLVAAELEYRVQDLLYCSRIEAFQAQGHNGAAGVDPLSDLQCTLADFIITISQWD